MLYEEFTKLTGVKIPIESYEKIIEPMYMATDMDKREFANFIKPSLKNLKPRESFAYDIIFLSDGLIRKENKYEGFYARVLRHYFDKETKKNVYHFRKLLYNEEKDLAKHVSDMHYKEDPIFFKDNKFLLIEHPILH